MVEGRASMATDRLGLRCKLSLSGTTVDMCVCVGGGGVKGGVLQSWSSKERYRQ